MVAWYDPPHSVRGGSENLPSRYVKEMVRSWVSELSAVIAATHMQRTGPRCEVRFKVGSHTFGLDLVSGELTDGVSASSEIVGDEPIFDLIMAGRETLQSAYRSGLITLSGDPEPFLRLSIAIDRCQQQSACVQH